ncbi:hypothetical protein RHGRI_005054 [Rhododendron griersonianum]|uniref:Uncharacterized protein n=1 Tax=Rhododendron griersonianum TaxID=479676 RepID=A0AAV6LAT0_9ERIC|nr:hypothetical protein RHGRI_005054 [Rhododendron griersonianum]
MCEAIFEILKDDNSLELIMASYRLLTELDKHFPRVYASKVEKSELPSPSSVPELVVVEDAWSPFISGSDSEREDANKNSGSLDFAGFGTQGSQETRTGGRMMAANGEGSGEWVFTFQFQGFEILIQDLAKAAIGRKMEEFETKIAT